MVDLLENLDHELWNEKGVIYCYTNKVNGKRYIGQTIQKLIKRHQSHMRAVNNRTTNYDINLPIHRAIRKYGIENFSLSILYMNCLNDEKLDKLEMFFIKRHKTLATINGYNVSEGGRNGNKFAGKTKEEMKELSNNISKAVSGKNNYMYGKKYSEEYKNKMRENSKSKIAIIGINIKTKEVITYVSIRESEKDGFSTCVIYQCCEQNKIGEDEFFRLNKRHRPQHKGYKWFYLDNFMDIYESIENIDEINFEFKKKMSDEGKMKLKGSQSGKLKSSSKPIVAINLETLEVFNFNSLMECVSELNKATGIDFKKGSVCAICSYHSNRIKRKERLYGFTFYYLNDYTEEIFNKDFMMAE